MMEFLFSAFDRLLELPLIERIRVEGIESQRVLALKNGALLSVIRLDGCMGMSGPAEFAETIEATRIALSPFLSKPGHAIEFSFARDPEAADVALERSIRRCRNRAAELGLDIDGILTERKQRLCGLLVSELNLVAVHTLPRQSPSRSNGLDLPTDADSSEAADTGARHMALTEALCRAFRARGLHAEILDSIAALREVRASMHPSKSPWKDEWTPILRETASAADSQQAGWSSDGPELDEQLATADAEILDGNTVRLGESILSAYDVAVAAEVLKPFNELVNALTSAPEPIAWRCSFLLEPGGLKAVRLKEQYVQLFSFAAPARNARIRDAVSWLRQIDGAEDTVIRFRMSLAAWTSEEQRVRLREHSAILVRAAEQWGNLSVDGVSGDPVATMLGSTVSLAPDSTAPVASAPLGEALSILPLDRQAGPWSEGSVLFRTDDGKTWPYLPGSSLQNSWVEIHMGNSGSGKSVAMNAINLAAVLTAQGGENGPAELPRMAIIDIGHSSKGLIDLLKDALPTERRHEVVHRALRMTSAHAINPFDTPPGMRAPYSSGRSFLVNFLSVLAGGGSDASNCPMTGLVGAAVDHVYRQTSDAELPKRYAQGEVPEVDAALHQTGFLRGGYTSWWEIADALFADGRFRESALAQARAVPTLADLIDASHADHVVNLYQVARVAEDGEPVLHRLRRTVSEAIRDLPVLSGATGFNPGYARIIALDLDEVAGSQVGGGSSRQASLMFMLARQLLIRDWQVDRNEVAQAVETGVLPESYRGHHARIASLSKRTPKLFAMDEYHRCGGLQGFRQQVLRDIREGRKHNIRVALSSQLADDFSDDILEAASTVFIYGPPSQRSTDRLGRVFGLGSHECSIMRTELVGPGRDGAPLFAIVRYKGGVCRQKLILSLGAAELWGLSTTPEDVALRERLYRRFSASDALLLLAARFPGGTAKPEIEIAATRLLELGRSDQDPAARAGVIESLAEELVDRFAHVLSERIQKNKSALPGRTAPAPGAA